MIDVDLFILKGTYSGISLGKIFPSHFNKLDKITK